MTTVEMAREVSASGGSYLLLSDTMAEALRDRKEVSSDDTTITTQQVRSPHTRDCGIRFQRCGGGRRVIRRSRGTN